MKPLKGIFILLDGMWVVFKHLFRRPVTLEYPEKKREPNESFRGKPVVKGCIGCGICKSVCPSNAISFSKDENEAVTSYCFDLKKCIFCGNCMYYCPYGAIKMTKSYELASENKSDLQLNYKGGADD